MKKITNYLIILGITALLFAIFFINFGVFKLCELGFGTIAACIILFLLYFVIVYFVYSRITKFKSKFNYTKSRDNEKFAADYLNKTWGTNIFTLFNK